MTKGWNKETRNKVILVLASVLLCLYFIEISISFLQVKKVRRAASMRKAAQGGIPFDKRSVKEFIRDLNNDGVEAYPAIWPGSIIRTKGFQNGLPWQGGTILPLAGISRVLTILGNETGQYAVYQSDEHGFNNPYGLFQEKKIDVALIGDSLTQGCCVSPGEDLGALLRKPGFQVLNLGYGFNGPLLELATLMEYAKPMRPRLVLWLYFEGNDLQELSAEARLSGRLETYFEEDFSQGLIHKQQEIDQVLTEYLQLDSEGNEANQWSPQGRHSVMRRVLTLSHLRRRLGMGRLLKGPFDKDLFMGILEKANSEIHAWGGRLVFVFLPARERFIDGSKRDNFLHRSDVLAMVNELNIQIIDIAEEFNGHPRPLSLFPFETEPHYNQEGYQIAARKIEDHLRLIFLH